MGKQKFSNRGTWYANKCMLCNSTEDLYYNYTQEAFQKVTNVRWLVFALCEECIKTKFDKREE